MRRAIGSGGLAALALLLAVYPLAAEAGQKLAIFPIDMTMPKSEDDFFLGVTGPSPEEQNRISLAEADLKKRVAESGKYDIIDLAPFAEEIKAARPIHECNGCEIDIAKKAKADLVMTSVIDKISETHLSLTVALIDVAQSKLVSNSSVLIQGNTDEAWLHGVKWLTKNRLLAEGQEK